MNYIDSLENLNDLLQNNEDVIFVPGIRAGKSVLDWLEYSNNLDNVACVATIKQLYTLYIATDIFSEKNLPVLPLHCLQHYRETGIFIVAMSPKVHEEVYDILTQFGCKNIFFLSIGTYIQIIEDLKKIMSPEQVMQRFMSNVTTKLNKLEEVIAEQNEICAVNSAAFEKYRNAFRGKKVVIIAGGPTVNYYKPIDDAIHIGINFAWLKENVSMDFLFMMDRYLNDEKREVRLEHGFSNVKDRIFIGKRLPKTGAMIYSNFPIDISLRNDKVFVFYLEYSVPEFRCSQQIYQDICYHPVANFRTTVFPAMMFALFTYPAELYLVGCDMTHSHHFYSKEPNILWSKPLKVGYARMKAFAEHHYPETKIISINPIGLKGLFTDVYTDEYKAALEEKNNQE